MVPSIVNSRNCGRPAFRKLVAMHLRCLCHPDCRRTSATRHRLITPSPPALPPVTNTCFLPLETYALSGQIVLQKQLRAARRGCERHRSRLQYERCALYRGGNGNLLYGLWNPSATQTTPLPAEPLRDRLRLRWPAPPASPPAPVHSGCNRSDQRWDG